METILKDNVRSLGGNYGVNRHLSATGDGGGKAHCPELFAKAFFEANP